MSDKARLCVTDATVEMGISKVRKTLKKDILQYNILFLWRAAVTLHCGVIITFRRATVTLYYGIIITF